MTTPFPFVSGAVLTAAQLNAITTLPINAQTASYTLTATDAGSRITMSSASATTITVNTGLFTAGQSLRIQNLNGGGVCTVTAGTATVTSAGPLAIPSWGGGQLYFTSASAAVWFPDAATASPSGLVFITGTTFSGASTVSLPTSTFTSTYTNYRISLNVSSTASLSSLRMRFRASGTDNTASNYQTGYMTDQAFANTLTTFAYLTNCAFGASVNLNGTQSMDIYNPQSAVAASWLSQGQYLTTSNNSQQSLAGGVLTVTTAYDAITFFGDAGTLTGSYKVYGYSNS